MIERSLLRRDTLVLGRANLGIARLYFIQPVIPSVWVACPSGFKRMLSLYMTKTPQTICQLPFAVRCRVARFLCSNMSGHGPLRLTGDFLTHVKVSKRSVFGWCVVRGVSCLRSEDVKPDNPEPERQDKARSCCLRRMPLGEGFWGLQNDTSGYVRYTSEKVPSCSQIWNPHRVPFKGK